MTAYYNEIDPFAAAWLRELIKAGHIAPGDVDTRSIVDVRPDDLRKYTQCHFFAGIGVWSYSLRRAGWPDSRPIWTMSCPCQPFSAAGKGGGFDDERHLWPFAHYLVEECRPAVVAGEQVASKDGLAWLDLVQADMEGTGYAFGAVDTCAAGFGAPHIRQRLYWMGKRLDDTAGARHVRSIGNAETNSRNEARLRVPSSGEQVGRLGDDDARLEGQRSGYQTESGRYGEIGPVTTTGEFGGVGNTGRQSSEWDARTVPGSEASSRGSGRPDGDHGNGHSNASVFSGMADPAEFGRDGRRAGEARHEPGALERFNGLCSLSGRDLRDPGPTNGLWRDSDWLFCRDGKWRPVEPGTFPLAHGATARVGRLRGYGNAINAEQAQGFIEACIETLDGRFQLTDLSDFAAYANIQDVFG